MKIIKVKNCIECPYHGEVNGLRYCVHKKFKRTHGRIFTKSEIEVLVFTELNFPKWCGLPDKNNH